MKYFPVFVPIDLHNFKWKTFYKLFFRKINTTYLRDENLLSQIIFHLLEEDIKCVDWIAYLKFMFEHALRISATFYTYWIFDHIIKLILVRCNLDTALCNTDCCVLFCFTTIKQLWLYFYFKMPFKYIILTTSCDIGIRFGTFFGFYESMEWMLMGLCTTHTSKCLKPLNCKAMRTKWNRTWRNVIEPIEDSLIRCINNRFRTFLH